MGLGVTLQIIWRKTLHAIWRSRIRSRFSRVAKNNRPNLFDFSFQRKRPRIKQFGRLCRQSRRSGTTAFFPEAEFGTRLSSWQSKDDASSEIGRATAPDLLTAPAQFHRFLCAR